MRCRRRSVCAAPDRTSRAVTAAKSPCGTARWNAPSRATLSRRSNIQPGRNIAIWYHAGLADRLESIDLNRIFAIDLGGYSGMAKTENQLFHRQRYREAAQAVGKIGSHVLEWAVCREIALEQVGQTLGWSSRPQAYAAAVERMKTALDELRKLWGIGT
jgi:hypothetical protein